MKKIFRGLIIVALILLASITAVGFQVASGDTVVVGEGEVIEKNYTFAGSYFEHNGVIEGNLYVAGENAVINGDVMGNVFVAGNNIVINGFVNGDVYAAGQKIEVNGEVKGNIFGAGDRLNLLWSSKVGQDIFLAGNIVNIDGRINGDGYLTASRIAIRGGIDGDLNYSSKKADIDEESIGGSIYREEKKPESAGSIILGKIFTFLSFIFSVLMIWVVITFVINKDHKEKLIRLMDKENVISTIFLFGLVGLMISFILPVALFLTGVGIKLGIFTIVLNTSLLYLSGGIAIVILSNLLSKKLPKMATGNNILIVLMMAIVIGILKAIPIVSGLVSLPLLVIGYGLIIGSLIHKDKNRIVNSEE